MNTTQNIRAFYSELGRLRMLGGDRALDLANTIHWRDDRRVDFIPDYPALLRWCLPALLLSEDEMARLLGLAPAHAAHAARIHAQWRDLRTRFKDWLAAIAPGPAAAAPNEMRDQGACRERLVAALDAALADLEPRHLLEAREERGQADLLALPLRRSAAAILMLIMFPPEGKVRRCQADRCGGFFVDRSRSKPRRWCAMDSCGNRAKAAEFRRRQGG
jgi:predicted RNA-binding Zn ribbon-like protein